MEKLAPPQMRCGVQRPSPLMNGHWGYDDTATASPPITSPQSNEWGRAGRRGGRMGGWWSWTMGETQHGLQLVLYQRYVETESSC